MTTSAKKRDRNFQRRGDDQNTVAELLRLSLPRDQAPRTLPHFLPGVSLDDEGAPIPEEQRTEQVFENNLYIAVCGVVARKLQEYNTCNRARSENNVRRLYDAMFSGEWMYNGKSSVLVCSNTAVLDNQHFLEAASRYFEGPAPNHVRKPFLMRVEMGLPQATFATYDNGAKRTAADTLHVANITGEVNYGKLPDALLSSSERLLLQYLNNVHNLTPSDPQYLCGKTGLVNSRVTAILNAYPELIRSAAIVHAIKGVNSVLQPYVATVGHMLIAEVQSAAAATNFVRSVVTGAGLEEESPLLALRSVFVNKKKRSGRSRLEGTEALAFFLRAWNLFAVGRKIGLGRLKSFEENNKIPVPQKMSRARNQDRVEV